MPLYALRSPLIGLATHTEINLRKNDLAFTHKQLSKTGKKVAHTGS